MCVRDVERLVSCKVVLEEAELADLQESDVEESDAEEDMWEEEETSWLSADWDALFDNSVDNLFSTDDSDIDPNINELSNSSSDEMELNIPTFQYTAQSVSMDEVRYIHSEPFSNYNTTLPPINTDNCYLSLINPSTNYERHVSINFYKDLIFTKELKLVLKDCQID